ncbi:MAG: hypothetical protein IPI57_18995 [Candidatus Competibacteraceae bacterium]|nr:hypothetical protein [Candidatus Competibacteraceae bacterium]
MPTVVFVDLAVLARARLGACDDPPARRVNWLHCDKQGIDLQGRICVKRC